MEYEAVIGLEIHVQLKTRTKMFCACPNLYGADPNTSVCPVCLGYPGALPTTNREALRLCCTAGLLLGCRINTNSKWDRKNYFYPDMPKNYQISQYDQPICSAGGLDIEVDGKKRHIRFSRIHQEEDVAKSTHTGGVSLVDYNRAGVPLMEIVTEADLRSADEVLVFLTALRQILQYGGVGECNLELGQMRCDVNCSVRPVGQESFGVKTEIKNMNTFKGVHAALNYEIWRQVNVLRENGVIVQETRRWDPELGITTSMRVKEEAHDYRYFPEPDLLPVVIAAEMIERWRAALPELPSVRRQRYEQGLGLPAYDAQVLVAEKGVADYFERVIAHTDNVKAVSNWIMTGLLQHLSESGLPVGQVKAAPESLARLIALVDGRVISHSAAKDVFTEMLSHGDEPDVIVERLGLKQVSDQDSLESWVDKALAENTASVEAYRKGKVNAVQFLMGQVMKESRGKANPQLVLSLLKEKLGKLDL